MNLIKDLNIEIGEDYKQAVCSCCGRSSKTGHGFIYKNGNAYAVYYVGWSDAHLDRKVSLAIAIGAWDDSSTPADRTCFGIDAYEGENEFLFKVIEPNNSPWAETDLLGKMTSREKALNHHLLQDAFVIAEAVIREHKAIRQYLSVAP